MSATITETLAAQTLTTTFSGEKETDASYIPRGPVTTSLQFFRDPEDGAKPFTYVEKQPEGQLQSNYGVDIVEVTVNDIRGHESEFSLDKDAFQTLENVSSELTYDDWADDQVVEKKYYPEVKKLLIDNVPGVHKVTIFDHTIRRSTTDAARGPVQRVHVDQTNRAAEWRVTLHDPDEAEKLLKGRYRIINVWRPLNGPIQAHPLGFASAATIEENHVVPVEFRYPHRTGETAGIRHGKDQKFFYWSGMNNDERLLLKCSDSRGDVGQRVPHTAFVDSRTPAGARGRESIEVRTLVYG